MFIEATRDSYLIQHILTPTRGRGTNEPSLIDLIFTSNEESTEKIDIGAPLGKSDHSMIKILYRSVAGKIPGKVVPNYARADFGKMKKKLNINWEVFFKESKGDIDLVWRKFVRKFNEAEKECIPKTIIRTGTKCFSYFLHKKSLSKRKKKYRLWKRFLETRDAKIYEEYCRCRNQVKEINKELYQNTRKGYRQERKDK